MKTILSTWNRFIVGLICFMMVNVNLTVDNQIIEMNMSSMAYASDSSGSDSSDSNVQQGQTGSVKIEEEDGGGLGFLTGGTTSFIVFMAAAIVIGKMLASCAPKSWDLISAAAGAVIFVAGELMTMFGSKAEIDGKKKEYSTHGDDGKIDDSQYQALVKEKEILQEVEKAASTKAKIQMAASAAFGVAAGIAAYNATQEVVWAASCKTAAGASVFCAPIVVTTIGKETTKKVTTLPSTPKFTESKALDAIIVGEGKTCVAAASAATFSTAGIAAAALAAATKANVTCDGYVAMHANSEMACVGYAVPAEEATGFMIPFAAIAKGISLATDFFAESAETRAWLWGSLSVYGLAVSNATKKQAEKAEDNIKEIDKLLAKMDMSRKESVMAQSDISKVNLSGALSQNLARPTELSEAVPCATGNGTLNQKTGQYECPPVIKPKSNSQSKKSLTASGYEGAVNLASELVAGIQGNKEISPSVQANIDKLGGLNSAIQKKMRNNYKKLNLANKQAGFKEVDPNKKMQSVFNTLGKAVKKSLLENGMTPNSLLAKARLGLPPIEDGKKEETKKPEEKSIATTGGKGITAGKKKNDYKFDFNVDDAVAKKNTEFAKNEEAAAEAGDENENKGDIIEDKSVSIFKVISIRYMKSGFNRLLDEL